MPSVPPQRPLLLPEGDAAANYTLVRRHREYLADWFAHHLYWPLDRQRAFLLDTLAEAAHLHPELRAEGLALVDLDGDCTDASLPEEGTVGHLTFLLATWLADRPRVRRDRAPKKRPPPARTPPPLKKEAGLRGVEVVFAELVLARLALIERLGETIRR